MLWFNRHIVLMAALVLAAATVARAAGDIKVTVTFDANNGMDDADKTAVIAARQKKYDDAGLTNVKFSTMAGGNLTLNFEASAQEKKFGDSDKKGKKARELSKF